MIDDDMGVQELCAYVVADEEVNLADLRGHLAHKLPAYMILWYSRLKIPNAWVCRCCYANFFKHRRFVPWPR